MSNNGTTFVVFMVKKKKKKDCFGACALARGLHCLFQVHFRIIIIRSSRDTSQNKRQGVHPTKMAEAAGQTWWAGRGTFSSLIGRQTN